MSLTNRLAAAKAARRTRHTTKQFSLNLNGVRCGTSLTVRRNSQHAGEKGRREWRAHNVFRADERRARFQAVREWDHQEKQPGKPWGPLEPNGARVFDFLLGRRDFKTGQLDPAISEIVRVLKLCVQTVCSVIDRLTGAGLLVKLRRTALI